ncbi:MAG: radical SAM protein [Nitrospirae bacterium]|nr:radical SAM protein [Nitrospirota bacterium]MBF0591926.1 radical SAM protein [Nitrospirota bacterium]
MHFIFINPNRALARSSIWSVVNSITPPIGLALLSALLERQGHSSQIIDAMALNLDVSGVLSAMDIQGDSVVGITATTPDIDMATDIARAVRNRYPRLRILMGGVHPTIYHYELVESGICDLVIRGEAEVAIVALANEEPFEGIANLTWRTPDAEVVENAQSSDFVDLNDLPMPNYARLPMGMYHSALGSARRAPSIGMITSRGCPGKCTFCFSSMFGSRVRVTAAGGVFDHIMHLKGVYGIREISFYDDTFTANRKRVEQLCNLLISEKVDISWSCFARVDTVNPDILKLMRAAGCHQVMYGFESADDDILRSINKKVTSDRYRDVIKWTRDAAIDIRGAFMLGLPGEGTGGMTKTIEFSKAIDIQFAIFNITTPFPGTALFKWAMDNGYIRHTRWSHYDMAHAILALPAVSATEVEAAYKKAYREFYLRPRYVLNRLRSISTREELLIHLRVLKGILSMLIR